MATAVGTRMLAQVVDREVSAFSDVRRWYFHTYDLDDGKAKPSLYAFRHESGLDGMVDAYIHRFIHSDPLIPLLTHIGPGLTACSVAPTDVGDSEYRTIYMENVSIVQRVSLIWKEANRCLVMNVSRSRDAGVLSSQELSLFGTFSLLVFPLLIRSAEIIRDLGDLTYDFLEGEVAHQFPDLSPRERQVCIRIVLGQTAKSIARELGISVETAVTYKKRAFQRLGIGRREQLSRLLRVGNFAGSLA
jgi:DNA-binding CsgD family transcriptional regulator